MAALGLITPQTLIGKQAFLLFLSYLKLIYRAQNNFWKVMEHVDRPKKFLLCQKEVH